MKEIKIPLVHRSIEIFHGTNEKEYNAFAKIVKQMGGTMFEKKELEDIGGFTYGSVIYIPMIEEEILFHELSHALNCIFEKLGCEKEDEFKSYIWGYVAKEALKLFKKELK